MGVPKILVHKVFVPKQSGVHRFACLALYRALLRQCSRLPPTTPDLIAPKQLIQNKFNKYKKLQSPSQTKNALKAGYEALDLIQSASEGHKHSLNRITRHIAVSHSIRDQNRKTQIKRTPPKREKPISLKVKKKEENRRFQESTARRHPGATSILSRPRPVVSGKRRVPVFVNARGVPFLRIKKPQPKNLTGTLNSKLANRWNKIQRRDRLQVELLFAQDEDRWDKLTIDSKTEKAGKTETWAHEVEKSIQYVFKYIQEFDIKNHKLAEEMWKVVLAERKLAAQEEADSASLDSSLTPAPSGDKGH